MVFSQPWNHLTHFSDVFITSRFHFQLNSISLKPSSLVSPVTSTLLIYVTFLAFSETQTFQHPKSYAFLPTNHLYPQVMETLWFSSVLMSWLLLGHLYVLFFWSLMTWWIISGLYPGCHYCPFPYTQTTGNISSTPRTLVIWWLLIHKSRPSISFWLRA